MGSFSLFVPCTWRTFHFLSKSFPFLVLFSIDISITGWCNKSHMLIMSNKYVIWVEKCLILWITKIGIKVDSYLLISVISWEESALKISDTMLTEGISNCFLSYNFSWWSLKNLLWRSQTPCWLKICHTDFYLIISVTSWEECALKISDAMLTEDMSYWFLSYNFCC